MLGILTVNWKPRPLCLMEEGSNSEASWVPGNQSILKEINPEYSLKD